MGIQALDYRFDNNQMGNSQPNVVLPVVGNPNEPDPWKVTENIAYCDLVTNVETGQMAESYTVPLDGRIKIGQEFEKYEYRRIQNQNLVKVYRVYKRNSEYLCSGMDFINVKTQRIPWRINQIRQLTLPEGIYTLGSALVGYKRIRELIGHVKVDGNMVGVSPTGQVRVWLNENLAKNHPEMEFEFDPQMPEAEAQRQMIQYIVHTVKIQMQGQQFPPEITQRLTAERLRTFDSAIALVKQIAQSLGLNLGQTRIDVRATAPAQIDESKISNRQSLPPMPSTIQQSSVNPVQISQVLQPGVSQLIQGQSQVIQRQSQVIQGLPPSPVQNPSIINQTLNYSLSQSEVNQLNNNTIQLVRKSSSNSNLRNSGVMQNRESLPIQIVINRASEIFTPVESPVIQMITPHVQQQAQLPIQIPQTPQVAYQHNLPPMNGRPTSAKGRPPMPGAYNKPPPEVIPYQIVDAVNQLRRSRGKQLRRSMSRQSNETATFMNVSRQVNQVQVQEPPIVQIQPQQPIMGVRAQSPAPSRNLSNSRILVGPRIVGPPVTQIPISAGSRTQIMQQLPRVISHNHQQIMMDRPIPQTKVVQTNERVVVKEQFQGGDRVEYLPIQYQKKNSQTIVERAPMINQIGGHQRVVVKKSVEKIGPNISSNNSMTVINTQTNTGSGVVHLLRHHNRADEPFYEQGAKPQIPKPTTAGEASRGIAFLNQKHNLSKY